MPRPHSLIAIFFFSLLTPLLSVSQNKTSEKGQVVDKIAAIVGEKIILKSDIEAQYQQYQNKGIKKRYNLSGQGRTLKCKLMDAMLKEKMLLMEARRDSLRVDEQKVEAELERRIRYFASMMGSRQKLEDYYGKSIVEMKEDFREKIHNRMLTRKVRQSIMENVSVTPTGVKEYYNSIPEDSLPYFNAQVEVAQIVRYPEPSSLQDSLAKQKAKNIHQRIVEEGEDFKTMALIYSEDSKTAKDGGKMGLRERDELPKALQRAAFNLKAGQVSRVIKSKEGFHILKLIQRRGEKVNLRHILIEPTITRTQLTQTEEKLDSIRSLIINDSLSFARAAQKFSQDEQTKHNGGMVTNPRTQSTHFDMDQLNPSLYYAIEKLEVGEVSDPNLFQDKKTGQKGYKIVKLVSETEPHRASLQKDYSKIKNAALQQQKTRVMEDWLEEKMKETYIYIASDYKNCENLSFWIKHSKASRGN